MSHRDFTYQDWALLGKKDGASSAPFFKRSYAGYSKKQLDTIASILCDESFTLFDPMAGQAYGLSTLTWLGHDICLNDYNPALMLLAWLRTREIMQKYDELKTNYLSWLDNIDLSKPVTDHKIDGKLEYQDTWLAPNIIDSLSLYSNKLDSLEISEILECGSQDEIFKFSILVLTARRLVVYSKTDNVTWLKPGGLQRQKNLKTEILSQIEELTTWREQLLNRFGENLFQRYDSKCKISCRELSLLDSEFASDADFVICSPPYANRLDYSVMWAPELIVLETVLRNRLISEVKQKQVGSNVVKGKVVSWEELDVLPSEVVDSLCEIRESSDYASASYYYKYFANFCIDLYKSILCASSVSENAIGWLVFIRDTARKDTLIQSHLVVERALKVSGYNAVQQKDLNLVRSHIGLTRKMYAAETLHGLVQREWSLQFLSSEHDHES